jgi:hypothetical protein
MNWQKYVLSNLNIQALHFFTIYRQNNYPDDQFLNLVIEKTLSILPHPQYRNSLIFLSVS